MTSGDHSLSLAIIATPPVVTAQSGPYLIVPGHRVGVIELGMRPDEVLGLLGTPLLSNCHPDIWNVGTVDYDCAYTWSTYESNGQPSPGWNGLSVLTLRGVVVEVDTVNPQYLTAQGIHVESSEQQVRRAFGPPRRFEDRTRIEPRHPSCCYEHMLQYPGIWISTGYAPGICRDLHNPARWVIHADRDHPHSQLART